MRGSTIDGYVFNDGLFIIVEEGSANVNGVIEMTRLIDITRTYTQISSLLQQQSDMRRNAVQQLADVPA